MQSLKTRQLFQHVYAQTSGLVQMALVPVSLRVVPADRIRFSRALSPVALVDPGPTLFQIHLGHLLFGLLSADEKTKKATIIIFI